MTELFHYLPPPLTRGNVDFHRFPPRSESVALRAGARAREAVGTLHLGIRVALAVGLLAVLVGFAVLLLSPDDWQRAFIGAGVTAAGILTLAVTASVWTGQRP